MNVNSHKEMISLVIQDRFRETPKSIERISIGICNEVYRLNLRDQDIIARLSPHDKFLMGSHDHIPKFKALGVRVPDILAEDYSRSLIPLSYQILSVIEGQDLGQVIETLSDDELKLLAKEVASIFNKVKSIPTTNKFGVVWGGGHDELSDTWTERMRIWIEESKLRGHSTGIMDEDMLKIADNLFERYRPYFDTVKPTTYYGDICSKNIMIHQGKFSGLVDLDGLTQGDPLEAIGRIKLSWHGTHYGEIYSGAIMDELNHRPEERKLATMYALLNMISWACENGIQFNQNTKTTIDAEKQKQDKEIIFCLAEELNLN